MWYTFSFHTPSAFTTVAQWNVWESLANSHIYQGIKQRPGSFFYRMKKCLIFTPQDSSIYAAHTSKRDHTMCMARLSVCSPVGFNCATNSFVSRRTSGSQPPPFRIYNIETCWVCSPLVLNLLPVNKGFLPSALAWKRKHVIPFKGREAKGYTSKCTAAPPDLRLSERGRACASLKRGLYVITDSWYRVTVLPKFPCHWQCGGKEHLTYLCQTRHFSLGQWLADGWRVDFGVQYWLSFQKVFSWFINVYFNHFPHEFRVLWH